MASSGFVQRCYYEVLEVSRRADDEEIRKAYRKAALRWHPDRNIGNEEEANERFKEVQQAYSVLSDPDERAWYDSHRLAILRGETDAGSGSGAAQDDDGFDIWAFFRTSVFRGYGDDAGGFYRVYSEAFETISRLEAHDGFSSSDDDAYADAAYDDDGAESDGLDTSPAAQARRRRRAQKQQRQKQKQKPRPLFGTSKSSWREVEEFYRSWKAFRSRRSFAEHDVYNPRDATGRRVKRAVDKENRRAREKARHEYSERVRHLAEFVAKLDPRVKAHRAEALRRQAEQAERQAREKAQQKAAAEAHWKEAAAERDRALMEEIERLSMELDAQGAFNPFRDSDRMYERKPDIVTDMAPGSGDETAPRSSSSSSGGGRGRRQKQQKQQKQDEEDEEDEDFECVVCGKQFKSRQQLRSHENSRKHREAVKRVMEEVAMDGDEEVLAALKQQAGSGADSEGDADEDLAARMEALRLKQESKKERKKLAKMRKKMGQPATPQQQSRVDDTSDDDRADDDDGDDGGGGGDKKRQQKAGGDAEAEDDDGLTEKQRRRAQRKQKRAQRKEQQSTHAAAAAAAAAAYAAAREDEQSARSNKRGSRRAAADAAGADAGKPAMFVCGKCGAQFAGRNALFAHLRQTGHAIPL